MTRPTRTPLGPPGSRLPIDKEPEDQGAQKALCPLSRALTTRPSAGHGPCGVSVSRGAGADGVRWERRSSVTHDKGRDENPPHHPRPQLSVRDWEGGAKGVQTLHFFK